MFPNTSRTTPSTKSWINKGYTKKTTPVEKGINLSRRVLLYNCEWNLSPRNGCCCLLMGEINLARRVVVVYRRRDFAPRDGCYCIPMGGINLARRVLTVTLIQVSHVLALVNSNGFAMVSEKQNHTNATRFVHRRFPFWAKTAIILDQIAFHFGPNCIPFWAKTQSILRQNAFHFAAKRNPFCGKTQSILRQNVFYFATKRLPKLQKLEFINIFTSHSCVPLVASDKGRARVSFTSIKRCAAGKNIRVHSWVIHEHLCCAAGKKTFTAIRVKKRRQQKQLGQLFSLLIRKSVPSK